MIDIANRCGMETIVRKVDHEYGYEWLWRIEKVFWRTF
jgi:hypothetical protein